MNRGTRLRCFGEIRRGPLGLEIVHPEYRRISVDAAPLEEVLTPIYPTTEGVPQPRLRSLIDAALREAAASGVRDWIPQTLLAKLDLLPLLEALTTMHRPPRERISANCSPDATRHNAAWPSKSTGTPAFAAVAAPEHPGGSGRSLRDAAGLEQQLLKALPFTLTGAQSRALAEVDRDLAADRPMVRLVQGDVGCGKTVVAAAAAARAVGSGLQAALMAPTELLAEQHAKNFERWFRPLGIPVALVTGSLPARTRRSALEAVASGEIKLVVGTHAYSRNPWILRASDW